MLKNGTLASPASARQQRLAGAERADQQHALGNAAAEALVLVGLLEKVDDLGPARTM
jgi:hypothetical protein